MRRDSVDCCLVVGQVIDDGLIAKYRLDHALSISGQGCTEDQGDREQDRDDDHDLECAETCPTGTNFSLLMLYPFIIPA